MKINKLPKDLFEKCIKFGLLEKNTRFKCKKITDGVSSDIWHVNTSKKDFCIKRALSKLTVKEDWFAPIDRNNFEANYFKACKNLIPNSFPKILGHDNKDFVLAMEWFDNKRYNLWKKKLIAKEVSFKDAERVAIVLAKIHSFFFNKKRYEKTFTNDKTFFALRIEPYILFTSKFYPKYKKSFLEAAKSLTLNKSTLIHGDFSPKNILIGKKYPIILDAETACWGDPIFDLSFCSKHIILKGFFNSDTQNKYTKLLNKFIIKYFSNLKITNKNNTIKRYLNLLPILLLARVDGKSPVEYLNTKQKAHVRSFGQKLLDHKVEDIPKLLSILKEYEKK